MRARKKGEEKERKTQRKDEAGSGEEKANAVWLLTPVILALQRLKQEDCCESEVHLGCLGNSRSACLKKQRIASKGKDIPLWISGSH